MFVFLLPHINKGWRPFGGFHMIFANAMFALSIRDIKILLEQTLSDKVDYQLQRCTLVLFHSYDSNKINKIGHTRSTIVFRVNKL